MPFITVSDGAEIFYKDWGPKDATPIVFHHGWPLSADDWDNQMMFFLAHGYRVIAHDRRGHGRSTQTANGHDMDTYAADVAEVVKKLDLKGAETPDAQVKIADAWWFLSEQPKTSTRLKRAMRLRAEYWYQTALQSPEINGLKRAVVQKRIDDVESGGIPVVYLSSLKELKCEGNYTDEKR